MTLQECPHCITKVIFSNDGDCPSCKLNINTIPKKSKEDYLLDRENKETQRKIDYCKIQGPKLITGGVCLLIITLTISILVTLSGQIALLWYGGVIVGLGFILKGINFLRDAKEIKFQHDQKLKKFNKNKINN